MNRHALILSLLSLASLPSLSPAGAPPNVVYTWQLAAASATTTTAWTPPESASLICWIDSLTSDMVTAGSLTDRSGVGNHATQGTSTKRGTIVTEGGVNGLKLDGSDDYWILGTTSGKYPANDHTVVIVARRWAALGGGTRYLYLCGSYPASNWDQVTIDASDGRYPVARVSTDTASVATPNCYPSGGWTTNAYSTVAYSFDENNCFGTFNGVKIITDTACAYTASPGSSYHWLGGSSTASQAWPVILRAVLIYNKALSDAQILSIHQHYVP